MKPGNGQQRVSTLSRFLAVVFVFLGVVVLGDLIVRMYLGRSFPMAPKAIALLVIGLLVFIPLFLFVILRGRSPRWISMFEDAYGRRIRQRRIERTEVSARKLPFAVASIGLGVFLVFFGVWVGAFSGEGRWFAVIVFVLVWLIAAALLWRYFEKGSRNGNADGKSND